MKKMFFQWLHEVGKPDLKNGGYYEWAWKEAVKAVKKGRAWELPPWNCKMGQAVQWKAA
jgi:hypothetical protein